MSRLYVAVTADRYELQCRSLGRINRCIYRDAWEVNGSRMRLQEVAAERVQVYTSGGG